MKKWRRRQFSVNADKRAMVSLASGSWNAMSGSSHSQLISSHSVIDSVLFKKNCAFFVKLTRAGRWQQGRGLKATVKTVSNRFKDLHRKVAKNFTFSQLLSGLNKLEHILFQWYFIYWHGIEIFIMYIFLYIFFLFLHGFSLPCR